MRQHAEAAQAVCAVAAFAVACAARQTPAQRPTPKPEKVHRPPLKQLVLFRSGVGFFEHRAEVEGNATLELEFHVEEINDVLKSMTAEDLGGGRISAVRYGSRAPVGRLTVTSPKTARYGKTSRIVPIFPELRPYLQEAWDAADEGEQWVVPMLVGKPDKKLGTTFKKIIARAGVEGGQAVSEPPGQPANGTGADLPDLRRLQVAGQHAQRGPQALPDGHRGPLSGSGRGTNWG